MGAFIFFMLDLFLTLLLMSVVFPLPVSDTGTVRYRTLPIMTYVLILINSLIFLGLQAPNLIAATQAEQFGQFEPFIQALQAYVDQIWTYGYRDVFLRSGESIGAFATFTSMFMHSDLNHLLGNMVYLWAFGRRIEDACGPWRYLLFYLLAGMIANMGSEILNPANSDIPSIGASGAIAGIMGAYLILFPGARVNCLWILGSVIRLPIAAIRGKDLWSWTIPIPSFILLIYFAVENAIPSFEVMQQGDDLGGVNTLAHLAGFLACLLVLLFVRKDLFNRFIAGRSL
ncbi:MAG: rhomboid family intramembrane serine protease [Chloroflexi bacterium]|uniref:rhomboid family intramembrane serine protease n=1 Tax=Candidatus Flexifilum breve TaxID=3140694 RepID=UPI00313487CF|nr:rhomboid family intramembrane serine protease [Chloroflexota bacterium]MBK9746444.1 rhomboid family intramembrane serine protease [Chloroflexota bacterium]